ATLGRPHQPGLLAPAAPRHRPDAALPARQPHDLGRLPATMALAGCSFPGVERGLVPALRLFADRRSHARGSQSLDGVRVGAGGGAAPGSPSGSAAWCWPRRDRWAPISSSSSSPSPCCSSASGGPRTLCAPHLGLLASPPGASPPPSPSTSGGKRFISPASC